MQKQKLLATLVHISDLHIGSIDPDTGDAAISPAVQAGLDNFPLFDGLLGHRATALRDLAELVEHLRASDGNVARDRPPSSTPCRSSGDANFAIRTASVSNPMR